MDEPVGDAAELVSKLAQETLERHAEVQREIARSSRPFILTTEHSEVAYTLPPSYVPLSDIDFKQFTSALKSKWRLRLDMSEIDLGPLLKQRTREELATMSTEEVMQALVQTGKAVLHFQNGRYAISNFDYVPIKVVAITRETVLVSVAGISHVAEVVAQEVLEALWESAGASKSWDVLEPHIQRKAFATRTQVNLGTKAEALLHPRLLAFLDDEVVAGKQYASNVGFSYARDDFRPPADAVCTYAFDDLRIRIARFDPMSGESSTASLFFSVRAKSDYGTGRLLVSSEMPHDVHVELIGDLIERIQDAQAG